MSKIWYRCIRRATLSLHSTQFKNENSSKPPIPQNDETAQKRAQWEQFAFDVEAPGLIEVTNESHDTPADHQYTVSIDDVTEDLMACTCPHHVHRHDFCKHIVGVAVAIVDGSLDTILADEDDKTDDESDFINK
ncbi:SWIM zinc finger family protein [Haladaptatus halobius]|uniref:SWIM zinc finger family protein n=1 Tax=Haladaptatus halobius TaxID=2884875 RepID=UPI001D0B5191|nr:SWIM zinc finger family protein [Haladaptatus halobius]